MLDERGLDEFFAEHFHRTAFRFEVRDHYAVASDGGDFARYLAGEDLPDAARKNAWLDDDHIAAIGDKVCNKRGSFLRL